MDHRHVARPRGIEQNGMQSSLSMVYDREMGSMLTLLVSPLPRWYLLTCKLVAGVVVAVAQVYAFLLIAWLFGVQAPGLGYLTVLPVLIIAGLMLGALGLLLSSAIRQIENFAGIMNFVIFPMFFVSSALYPLDTVACKEAFLPAAVDEGWTVVFEHDANVGAAKIHRDGKGFGVEPVMDAPPRGTGTA